MTMTFKLLDQHAKYLGQRLLSSVIFWTHRHTHTHMPNRLL